MLTPNYYYEWDMEIEDIADYADEIIAACGSGLCVCMSGSGGGFNVSGPKDVLCAFLYEHGVYDYDNIHEQKRIE